MDEITIPAGEAQILMVIGSSRQVYPAADMANITRDNGARVHEINF